MKFYIGDYLRDTGHLSTCEHGAYVLLLFHAFTHGGVLPNDEVRLRNIAKMSAKDWKRSSHTLRAFFYVDGDTLRQSRIDRELGEISKSSEQKSTAGKASAAARAAQRKSNGNPTGVEVLLGNPPVDTESDKKIQKERKIQAEDSDLRSAQAPPDARRILWQQGLPILRALIGKSDSQTRNFLGKMVGHAEDDCARTLRIILEAQSLKPTDPTAWLLKAAAQGRSLLDTGPVEPTAANPAGRRTTHLTGMPT
jgi:uncharacterized protein YdaU (DUF1376 family)